MGVFAVLLALWCATALVLGRYARLVPGVIRVSRGLSPCLFIVIGVIILVSSGVLTRLGVTRTAGSRRPAVGKSPLIKAPKEAKNG
ncbi:MAG TPA: hypothetical protein VH641_01180 [Streptosporangiaceae bacterium]|jgi:cadmium resistance protein CadD (predicted permease)